MAFSEKEIATILEQLEREFWSLRRPPHELRDKIREGQRISGQSVELFFTRPSFRDRKRWIEDSVAKVTYVRSRDHWRIYWKRADLKWHSYPPMPRTKTLSAALRIIHEDAKCCFFG